MNNEFLKHILRFFLLLVLQILVFNHVYIFGFINPDVYLLALLLLPLTLPKSAQYGIAFATGLIVDIFDLTFGIHALAAMFMIALRPLIIKLLSINKKKMDETVPSPKNKDFKWLLYFTLLTVLVQQTFVSIIETWSFNRFGMTVLNILLNTLFTSLLILCIEYIFIPKKSSTAF